MAWTGTMNRFHLFSNLILESLNDSKNVYGFEKFQNQI